MSIAGLISGGIGLASSLFKGDKDIPDPAAGISTALQGSNVPSPAPAQSQSTGSQAKALFKEKAGDLASEFADSGISMAKDAVFGSSGARAGRNNRDYLDASFPELNPWEKSGAAATGMGTVQAQFDSQSKLLDKQLANQTKIARMQADKDIEIAGIQSQTSRLNTKDQVYAQNTKLDSEIAKNVQTVANLVSSKGLTDTRLRHEVAKIIQTEVATRKLTASTKQVEMATHKLYQDIINAKYSKSTIGKIAGDASTLLSDAISSFSGNWSKNVKSDAANVSASGGIPLGRPRRPAAFNDQ